MFSSYGQLGGGDTDTERDVYRFDAETDRLNRVSIGEDADSANGNGESSATIIPGNQGGSVLEQHEMNSRAISEDGSRIVFGTSEPLSPDAVNGLENVYEWRMSAETGEGVVSLVSSGSADEPVSQFVIAPGGRDVFFVTTQGLVPQDVDGAPDLYDARLGGGFPAPPASLVPCVGDACQGPLTSPTPLLVPATVSQAPGENVLPAKRSTAPKAKRESKASRKHKKRKAKKSSAGRRGRSHGRPSQSAIGQRNGGRQ